MNSFAYLAVTIGIFALACSVDAQLPNNLYYLVNHTISQNNAQIRLYEIQINVTDNRFNHYVESVRHNNRMVERTIDNYVQDLTVFGFLNVTNQNCVVKYAEVPNIDAHKLAINTCANKAKIAFSGALNAAQTQITSAKSYNLNIKTGTETCYTNNKSDNQKMGDCINLRISDSNKYIDAALNRVDRELQVNLDLFDVISRDATECIYNAEINLGRAIENNRETLRLCKLSLKPKTNMMFDEN